MGRLEERVVLVTGGGRNIGRAVAAASAREGAIVAVLEREEGGAAEAVAGIRKAGGTALEVVADLRDSAAVEAAFERVSAEHGAVHGLVNNAGVYVRKPLTELTDEDWDLTLDTNLKAAFFATRAFVGHARERGGGGSVVNIVSVHAKVGDGSVVAHCASKAGLLGLTLASADAGRADGIRVNAVSPGAVNTWGGPWDAAPGEKPLEGLLVPAQVADAVVWLLSDEASGVTGTDLEVHGGTSPSLRLPS